MLNSKEKENIQPLGDSEFNYDDYSTFRFIHYYQQIHHILKLSPKRILEIGPGDHTVSDFLKRKSFYVKTLDIDKNLYPDYIADIRNPIKIGESFDLILASEVLEHLNFKYFEIILENIKNCIVEKGYLILSLPYSTIRLFPKRKKYGGLVSCEGRLYTFVPYKYFQNVFGMILKGFYRVIFQKYKWGEAFKVIKIPEYPDDKLDVHHWDLGFKGTDRKTVRSILKKHFKLIEEKVYYNTNCVFYILEKE